MTRRTPDPLGCFPISICFSSGSRAGMWLPETAVDLHDTSACPLLAGNQVHPLSPNQPRTRRKDSTARVSNADGGRGSTPIPYTVELAGGRSSPSSSMTAPLPGLSRSNASWRDGEHFARPAALGFPLMSRQHPQLVHIATDGETYGHHHEHGEMALRHTRIRQDRKQ